MLSLLMVQLEETTRVRNREVGGNIVVHLGQELPDAAGKEKLTLNTVQQPLLQYGEAEERRVILGLVTG